VFVSRICSSNPVVAIRDEKRLGWPWRSWWIRKRLLNQFFETKKIGSVDFKTAMNPHDPWSKGDRILPCSCSVRTPCRIQLSMHTSCRNWATLVTLCPRYSERQSCPFHFKRKQHFRILEENMIRHNYIRADWPWAVHLWARVSYCVYENLGTPHLWWACIVQWKMTMHI
jgi:hypothetical protein